MNYSRKNNEYNKINKYLLVTNSCKSHFKFLALVISFMLSTYVQKIHSQEIEKNKVRLKVDYVKIMSGNNYLDIKATAKIDNKNTNVSNINLSISNEYEGEEFELGNTTTNMYGESRFLLKSLDDLKPDSTKTYNITVLFKGNDAFKKASKDINFKNANINAKIIDISGTNYLTATLTEASDSIPIKEEHLNVQVQRLFRPLRLGDEFIKTDENGNILVPIAEGIPGIDGNLIIEVVLNESDDFGTIKTFLLTPLGVPIVDESTFDERTMWSPPNKTPIYLWIIPNLLILGVWGTIVYLIINLLKIYKSKIQ